MMCPECKYPVMAHEPACPRCGHNCEHEAARPDGAELGAAPGSANVSGAPKQNGAGGWRDEITCPHCGYEAMESYDWGCPDVDWTEITECPECEKQFEWTRLKTVQYLAIPVAGVGGENVDAGPGHSPSAEVCEGGRKASELKQDANRHSQH